MSSAADANPIHELFVSLDIDGDGVLSQGDLRAVLPDMALAKIDDIIAQLDTTGNGTITLEEFYNGFDVFVQQQKEEDLEESVVRGAPEAEAEAGAAPDYSASDQKQIHDLFFALDGNDDGLVGKGDLKMVLEDLSDEQMDELMRMMDKEPHEELSVAEFRDAFHILTAFGEEHSKGFLERKATITRDSISQRRASSLAADGDDTREADAGAKPELGGLPSVSEDASVVDDLPETRPRFQRMDTRRVEEAAGQAGFNELKDMLDSSELVDEAESYMDGAEEEVATSLPADEQLTLLRGRVGHMRASAQNAQRKYQLLSVVGEQLESENLDLHQRLTETSTNLRAARAEAEEARLTVETYRNTIDKYRARNQTLEERVKRSDEQLADTAEQLRLESEQRGRLADEMGTIRQELDSMKSDRSATNRNKFASRRAELSSLLTKLKRDEMAELKEKNAQLEQANAQARDTIEKQSRLIDDLRAQIKELQRLIEELRRSGAPTSLKDELAGVSDDEEKEDDRVRRAARAESMLRRLRDRGNVHKDPAKQARSRTMVPRARAPSADAGPPPPQVSQFAAKLLSKSKKLKGGGGRKPAEVAREKEIAMKKKLADVTRRLAEEQQQKQDAAKKNRALEDEVRRLEGMLASYQLREEEERAERAAREEAARKAEAERKAAARLAVTVDQQDEIRAYSRYINSVLCGDADLAHLLPLDPDTPELVTKLGDGWLLAKFVNYAQPATVDTRALTLPGGGADDMGVTARLENVTLALEASKSVGAQLPEGATAEHLVEGASHVDDCIGAVWELVRAQLLGAVSLRTHPELVRLLSDGEEPSALLKRGPRQVLIDWTNHHVRAAGADAAMQPVLQRHKVPRALLVQNIAGEHPVLDGTVFSMVMSRLLPNLVTPEVCDGVLGERSADGRVQSVGALASRAGIQSDRQFISPAALGRGGRASGRLCTAFLAVLFNHTTGLALLSEEEMQAAELLDEDEPGDSREERAFRMWINSMNIGEGSNRLYIHNLFSECRDGLVLLRVEDKIRPGIVNWRRVEMNPVNKFKRLSNANMAVDLGTKELKLSLVGIGGVDLVDGNKKLTLSVVWQLMHLHITTFLAEVYERKFGGAAAARSTAGGAKRPSVILRQGGGFKAESSDSDKMIVKWANLRAKELSAEQQAQARGALVGTAYELPYGDMQGFGDSALADSLFFFHLMWAMEPRAVDWRVVTKGATEEERLLNARYAISVARKIGAQLFVLPEDIVDVRPKMVTCFVSAILALDTASAVA